MPIKRSPPRIAPKVGKATPAFGSSTWVGVGVGVAPGGKVGVGVRVTEDVGVGVKVTVPVGVGVIVPVGVGVGVPVSVGVGVGDPVGVGVIVPVRVGVGVTALILNVNLQASTGSLAGAGLGTVGATGTSLS